MIGKRANQPMKLEGSRNTRELGGYPTAAGANTANGAFLRSDKASRFTQCDMQLLYEYGIRHAIDLRSAGEIEKEPCVLRNFRDMDYVNIQLLDNIHSDETKSHMPPSLGEMYVGLLERSQPAMKALFEALADAQGGVIFFCTAGKDRTGVTAMLLLKLAGVDDATIVADYQATYANIRSDMEASIRAAKQYGMEVPEYLMRSDPENMRMALDWLESKYGSAEAYLKQICVSQARIDAIRGKLLGK